MRKKLYQVNPNDWINIDKIDAIHIDKSNHTMVVICSGVPIKVTYEIWQKHICEQYLSEFDYKEAMNKLGIFY